MSSSVPATSTSEAKNKAGSGSGPRADSKRRAKAIKDLELSIHLLQPDSKAIRDQKDLNFAQAYLVKAGDRLGPNLYTRFLRTLSEFDASRGDSVADLYRNVSDLLKGIPDLEEEFLAFLLPKQAMEVGRFIDHLSVTSMRHFFRKLEVSFAKQPYHMRKIFEALSRLSEQKDVTIDQVKTTIVPLLRGNAILTDYFLQLFPSERPSSATCAREEFERLVQFENATEPFIEKESDMEVIEVPDVDDPYGGSRCPCKCHRGGSPLHCISCGLKFIKGRVFIQRGKALRQAELVVKGVDRDEFLQRIVKKGTMCRSPFKVRPKKRPAESSPSKSCPTATDDDCGENLGLPKLSKLKQMKTSRNKPSTDSGDKTAEEDEDEDAANICSNNWKDDGENSDDPKSPPDGTGEDTFYNPKDDREVVCEAAVIETISKQLDTQASSREPSMPASETKLGSNVTAMRNIDDLVEKDGDSATDVETTISADGRMQSENLWTRDEDKVILQTFQQDGDSVETFTKINTVLPTRSIFEIRSRFQVLMQLLNQMAQGDDNQA